MDEYDKFELTLITLWVIAIWWVLMDTKRLLEDIRDRLLPPAPSAHTETHKPDKTPA